MRQVGQQFRADEPRQRAAPEAAPAAVLVAPVVPVRVIGVVLVPGDVLAADVEGAHLRHPAPAQLVGLLGRGVDLARLAADGEGDGHQRAERGGLAGEERDAALPRRDGVDFLLVAGRGGGRKASSPGMCDVPPRARSSAPRACWMSACARSSRPCARFRSVCSVARAKILAAWSNLSDAACRAVRATSESGLFFGSTSM